jgi:hypothetical protein
VARRHFRELLEAKQARVRQGPAYPPANPHTGQRDLIPAHMASDESSPPPPAEGSPDPEATYGGPTFAHGRGNQGMRRQK